MLLINLHVTVLLSILAVSTLGMRDHVEMHLVLNAILACVVGVVNCATPHRLSALLCLSTTSLEVGQV